LLLLVDFVVAYVVVGCLVCDIVAISPALIPIAIQILWTGCNAIYLQYMEIDENFWLPRLLSDFDFVDITDRWIG